MIRLLKTIFLLVLFTFAVNLSSYAQTNNNKDSTNVKKDTLQLKYNFNHTQKGGLFLDDLAQKEIIFDKDNEGKIKRSCECGGELSLKTGRFGAFIGCSKYPDCKFTRPMSRIKAAEQDYLAEPKEIGKTEKGRSQSRSQSKS